MCEVVSKYIALKNTHCYPKTHCFPTCAHFYPIILKRRIITDDTDINSMSKTDVRAKTLLLHKVLFDGRLKVLRFRDIP